MFSNIEVVARHHFARRLKILKKTMAAPPSMMLTPDDELRLLVDALIREQCKQERQVEEAENELRKWKGLALKERSLMTQLQSQLTVSQTQLTESKKDTRSLREEVAILERQLGSVIAEVEASKRCVASLKGGDSVAAASDVLSRRGVNGRTPTLTPSTGARLENLLENSAKRNRGRR